jgi:hypothetical protein
VTETDKIHAFLQVRSFLPDAGQCTKSFLLVTIGNKETDVHVDLHVESDTPLMAFLFRRRPRKTYKNKFQWVCSDQHMQQVVYKNYLDAMLMLRAIEIG